MFDLWLKIQRVGYGPALRLLMKRAPRYAWLPAWYVFTIRNISHRNASSVVLGESEVLQALDKKEQSIRQILRENENGRFLEIGIGEFPHIERLELMRSCRITYTACDFETVCRSHMRELEIRNIDTSFMRFLANRTGTYAWTLFNLLEAGERFDVIYLDGHHTFYVDLPAFSLAHYLLKPNGYFLVDDIQWTLDFIKKQMINRFDAWYFYKTIYEFDEYEINQRERPHMQMIAQRLLMDQLQYTRSDEHSTPQWWALRKPLTS